MIEQSPTTIPKRGKGPKTFEKSVEEPSTVRKRKPRAKTPVRIEDSVEITGEEPATKPKESIEMPVNLDDYEEPPIPWIKGYNVVFQGRIPVEDFLSVVSLIEYEEDHRKLVGAGALTVVVPTSLMMERYFTPNYTVAISMNAREKLQGGELNLFPKKPFNPQSYESILTKLMPLANHAVGTEQEMRRYNQLGTLQDQLVRRITAISYKENIIY